LRAAAKQSSVSFLDCHGAEAPRNDGFIPCEVAPARLFLTKGLTGRTWHWTREVFRPIIENQYRDLTAPFCLARSMHKNPRLRWTEPHKVDMKKEPCRRIASDYANWRRFSSGVSFVYGFSQLRTQSGRNINHPLCGCAVKVIQKVTLPLV